MMSGDRYRCSTYENGQLEANEVYEYRGLVDGKYLFVNENSIKVVHKDNFPYGVQMPLHIQTIETKWEAIESEI